MLLLQTAIVEVKGRTMKERGKPEPLCQLTCIGGYLKKTFERGVWGRMERRFLLAWYGRLRAWKAAKAVGQLGRYHELGTNNEAMDHIEYFGSVVVDGRGAHSTQADVQYFAVNITEYTHTV